MRDLATRVGGRVALVVVLAMASVTMLAGAALAAPPSPETVVGDATESIVTSLFNVLIAALPIVAGLIAVTIGFRFALKLIRRAG